MVRLLEICKRVAIAIATFRELALLIGVVLPGLRYAVSTPDLEVVYRAFRVYPPHLTSLALGDQDSTSVVGRVMTDTHSILSVAIRNHSHDRIEDLDVRIWGVESLHDIGAYTTSTILRDRIPTIIENRHHQDYELRLPELNELPAGAQIVFQLWGTMRLRPFGSNVIVSSSAKRTLVRREGKATGVGLFLVRNMEALGLVLSIWLVIVGIGRWRRRS